MQLIFFCITETTKVTQIEIKNAVVSKIRIDEHRQPAKRNDAWC